MSNPPNTTDVRNYLLGLQDRIVSTLQAEDGHTFLSDGWTRAPGERLQGG
jgi:coproporphyrinogen III oxidase